MSKKCDYEIGYGKPPKAHRIQPGERRNPKGRPRGSKNLVTDVREELSERVPIREGDRVRKVSKQRALVKRLLARALDNDVRAANTLIALVLRAQEAGDGGGEPLPLIEEEEALLDLLSSRAAARKAAAERASSQKTDGAGNPEQEDSDVGTSAE